MSDSKKYYYLKLKDNFFESDNMILLENMKDGYLYENILLKLYLKSLKDGGRLMLNGRIPYNSQMIASVTRHQVGTVEKSLEILEGLGLIEVLDSGAIYMSDIQNMIGESSTEADRKRAYRARIEREKNTGQIEDKCPDKRADKSPPEIREKRLDIRDKDIKYICPEPEMSPDCSNILLPLIDNTSYNVPTQKISKWEIAYPVVDVEQELRKMSAWLDANPTRRKTPRGIERFINNWLSKEQDRGGVHRNDSRQQVAKKNKFNNFDQRSYDYSDLERKLLGQ